MSTSRPTPRAPDVHVVLPVRLPSIANTRLHHMARHRLLASHKESAYYHVLNQVRELAPPLVIELTRIGPRNLDSDNLAAAFKGCRDGVAAALRVDDGSPLLTWRYGQRRAAPREAGTRRGYGVEITITPGASA